MIDANHLVFVVVDGRSPATARGVTMTGLAQIMQSTSAPPTAYNLDGGGSSTMYFDGALVNNPLGKGKERGTSDILYIGAAEAAMIVLIPAYEPDDRCSTSSRDLARHRPRRRRGRRRRRQRPGLPEVFDAAAALGATVIAPRRQPGQGLRPEDRLRATSPRTTPGQDVVCADSDGQHTRGRHPAGSPSACAPARHAMVLGARQFTGDGAGAQPIRQHA